MFYQVDGHNDLSFGLHWNIDALHVVYIDRRANRRYLLGSNLLGVVLLCQLYSSECAFQLRRQPNNRLKRPNVFCKASHTSVLCITIVQIWIGILLGTLGSWLRIFVRHSYYWIVVGSFVSSVGYSFVVNCVSKVSQNWFAPEQVRILFDLARERWQR